MGATQDAVATPDVARVRLRTAVFDALTNNRGVNTDGGRATLFDVDRSTIVRLRHGHCEASLTLAMRMARILGVPVETLFEGVS